MAKLFNNGIALIIGVGNDLPGTVNDAKGIYEVLVNSDKGGYNPENIELITEKSATRHGILSALDRLNDKAKSDHSVILYYSGHGGHLKSSDEFFLVPNDFDAKNLSDTTVSSKELMEKLNNLESKKFFLILDCCHAAGMNKIDDEIETTEEKERNFGFRFKSPVLMADKFGFGKRNFVLSSCRDNEKSYMLKSDKYSLFTQCLIDGLEGKGNNSYGEFVNLIDVIRYVFSEVPVRSKEKQHPYFNKLDDVEIDFPLSNIPKKKREEFDAFMKENADNEELKKRITAIQGNIDNLIEKINQLKVKRQSLKGRIEQFSVDRNLMSWWSEVADNHRKKKEILKQLKN